MADSQHRSVVRPRHGPGAPGPPAPLQDRDAPALQRPPRRGRARAGIRELADAAGMPLILYLKSEDSFGSDKEAGLDAVGRLMRDGVAVAIKCAVVRDDPRTTPTSTDCCGASNGRGWSAASASGRPSCTCATSACRDSPRVGLHRIGGVHGALRGVPRRGLGPRRKPCAPTSSRSRICATSGDPRASCITAPSWRASRPLVRSPFVTELDKAQSSHGSRRSPGRFERRRHERPPPHQRTCGATDGSARTTRSFGHRSRAKQAGFSLEDISGKPVIAILNTWSDANPCHTHFRLRAEEVKRGVWQAGGFPMEIRS